MHGHGQKGLKLSCKGKDRFTADLQIDQFGNVLCFYLRIDLHSFEYISKLVRQVVSCIVILPIIIKMSDFCLCTSL